ncbi:MAG: 4-hydroxy-3-methylbut-2-enyl diphosphate reductase [Prevotellaceae bacterium]|nr:4-hydroxy-3-methylbut-2-enyl diphosphate reductase [Prevotellaceae bacterium]MDY3856038.1 4-hydroxy-3-methylbut-2-enyl diphosphate reductase [Bacteroidaceae bacterium]
MNINIEIDSHSGFCFGVTTAISKAEEVLRKEGSLYCLGDIVHNDKECNRLRALGLKMIDHSTFRQLHHVKVLLRAHGEPPETYDIARRNDIEIIDATCPVVLQLQKRVKKEYQQSDGSQIVIFGRPGHAEVLGLVGQTEGHAIVLDKLSDAEQLDFTRSIRLFSQTTKPLQEFRDIVTYIQSHIQPPATLQYFDTVCRQVANRMPHLLQFASSHDVVLFVSGLKSSNGRTLYRACQSVNPRSYMVEGPSDLDFSWFEGIRTLGICGATSTPKWLMEACRDAILNH